APPRIFNEVTRSSGIRRERTDGGCIAHFAALRTTTRALCIRRCWPFGPTADGTESQPTLGNQYLRWQIAPRTKPLAGIDLAIDSSGLSQRASKKLRAPSRVDEEVHGVRRKSVNGTLGLSGIAPPPGALYRDLAVLFVGWALGILSSPITDAIRRRSAKQRLTRAVTTELRSLQDTLASVVIQVAKRHRVLTRSLLEALMSTLKSSGHVIAEGRALRIIGGLLELDES